MRKLALFMILTLSLLSCKKHVTKDDCEDKICTEEFRSVAIKFLDNTGTGAEVKDYTVINQRTGEKLSANSSIYINTVKGYYLVVDDGNLNSLSAAGDDLKITGTSVVTGQRKSAVIKVSGGKCACHVIKISGPDQIAFD